MAKKESLYNEFEIEFIEKKLGELKEYIEARPFDKLADRLSYKETKNSGVIPMVVSRIEDQRKDLTQALKDYAELSQVVAKMREKEEAKQINVRGNQSLNPLEGGEI